MVYRLSIFSRFYNFAFSTKSEKFGSCCLKCSQIRRIMFSSRFFSTFEFSSSFKERICPKIFTGTKVFLALRFFYSLGLVFTSILIDASLFVLGTDRGYPLYLASHLLTLVELESLCY